MKTSQGITWNKFSSFLKMIGRCLLLNFCIGFAFGNMQMYKQPLESLIKDYDDSCQRKADILTFDLDAKGKEIIGKFKFNFCQQFIYWDMASNLPMENSKWIVKAWHDRGSLWCVITHRAIIAGQAQRLEQTRLRPLCLAS